MNVNKVSRSFFVIIHYSSKTNRGSGRGNEQFLLPSVYKTKIYEAMTLEENFRCGKMPRMSNLMIKQRIHFSPQSTFTLTPPPPCQNDNAVKHT